MGFFRNFFYFTLTFSNYTNLSSNDWTFIINSSINNYLFITLSVIFYIVVSSRLLKFLKLLKILLSSVKSICRFSLIFSSMKQSIIENELRATSSLFDIYSIYSLPYSSRWYRTLLPKLIWLWRLGQICLSISTKFQIYYSLTLSRALPTLSE